MKQKCVGMFVGLLLGMLPVSTEGGLRFLKQDHTLPEDYEFTDDSSPSLLWGYKDFELYREWVQQQPSDDDEACVGKKRRRPKHNPFQNVFTW